MQSIERRDVIALVEGVAVERPVLANRTLTALSKFFKWLAARDELKTVSPTVGVERPHKEKSRDRVLDEEELRQLWIVAGDPELGLGGTFLRLLLLTGARRDEIAAMPWSELDINKRLWKLPAELEENRPLLSSSATPTGRRSPSSIARMSRRRSAASAPTAPWCRWTRTRCEASRRHCRIP